MTSKLECAVCHEDQPTELRANADGVWLYCRTCGTPFPDPRVPDWQDEHDYQVGVSLSPAGQQLRHLRVWRRDGKDGISWDVLQAIKNHALGPTTLAVEVYPSADQLVNDTNMRHLWEVPTELSHLIPSLKR